MGRTFGKWMGMAVVAAMLCLCGLHGVGEVQAAGASTALYPKYFRDNR